MTKKSHLRFSSLCLSCALLGFAWTASSKAQEAPSEVDEERAESSSALPQVDPGQVPEGSVSGMGDINLYPRRIILDQRQRVASVGIYNKTPYDGDYEVSVADMLMTEAGRIVPLDNLPAGTSTDKLNGASDMLRWSPRRVMLPGSEAQTIRVMVRPPADLPDGEYRAHFSVVSIPDNLDEGFSIDDAVAGDVGDAGNVGVTIRPRFGISIPVILRIGKTTLDVGLEGLDIIESPQGTMVSLTITREGTRSAYGDVVISAPGQKEPLAIARGIGVYPELDSRQVRLPINTRFDLSVLPKGTTLTATFIDDDVAPGDVLATKDFVYE